jgi:hypothetical protein
MEINGDPLLWRDLATTIERLLADPTARIEHWVMIRCLCERVRIWGHGQEAEAWIYQLKDAWPAARGESFDHHSAQELP